jgi:hypothetical protein
MGLEVAALLVMSAHYHGFRLGKVKPLGRRYIINVDYTIAF